MLKETREIIEEFMKIHSMSEFTKIMKRYGLENIEDITDVKESIDQITRRKKGRVHTSFTIMLKGGRRVLSGAVGLFPKLIDSSGGE